MAKPGMRRLIYSQEQSVFKHLSKGEELFNYHIISEKVMNFYNDWNKYTTRDREVIMNKLVKEETDY